MPNDYNIEPAFAYDIAVKLAKRVEQLFQETGNMAEKFTIDMYKIVMQAAEQVYNESRKE